MKSSHIRQYWPMLAMILAGASSAETLSEALTQCAKVESSVKRLACFDRVTSQLRAYENADKAFSLPPAGRAAAPAARLPEAASLPAPAREATVQEAAPSANRFGLRQVNPDEPTGMTYNVVSVGSTPRKRGIYTMEDGSVWEQTDDPGIKIDVNDEVQIERGAMGSFFLTKEGVTRRIRVKRTR